MLLFEKFQFLLVICWFELNSVLSLDVPTLYQVNVQGIKGGYYPSFTYGSAAFLAVDSDALGDIFQLQSGMFAPQYCGANYSTTLHSLASGNATIFRNFIANCSSYYPVPWQAMEYSPFTTQSSYDPTATIWGFYIQNPANIVPNDMLVLSVVQESEFAYWETEEDVNITGSIQNADLQIVAAYANLTKPYNLGLQLDGYDSMDGVYVYLNLTQLVSTPTYTPQNPPLNLSLLYPPYTNGGVYPSCSRYGQWDEECSIKCNLPIGKRDVICVNASADYCSFFECDSNRVSVSTCSCVQSTYRIYYQTYIANRGEWVNVKPQTIHVDYINELRGPGTRYPPSTYTGDPIQNYTVTFDGTFVNVISTGNANYSVVISIDTYSNITNCTSTFFQFRIPDAYLSRTTTLYVEVYDINGLEYAGVFPIVGTLICRLKDCLICTDAYNNFDCLPATYKGLAIFALVILGIMAFIACPVVFFVLFYVLRWCWRIIYWVWRSIFCMLYRKVKSKFPSDTEYPAEPLTKKNSMMKIDQILKLAIIMGFIIGALGCSDSIIVSSNMVSCVAGLNCPIGMPNCETCTVDITAAITLFSVGASSCVKVTDTSGKDVANIEISFDYLYENASLSTAYYTSDWTIAAESVSQCPAPWVFCDIDDCTTGNWDYDRTVGGNLVDQDVIQRPGKSFCIFGDHVVGKCVGRYICIYTGVGIVPQGNVFQAFSISSLSFTPVVSLKVTDAAGTALSSTIWGQGTQTVSGYKLTTIGLFQSTIPYFNDRKLLLDTYTGDAYLTIASGSGYMRAGLPGDIQSSTSAGLQRQLKTTFEFFDSSLLKPFLNSDNTVTYTPPNSGISNLESNTSLPLNFLGGIWTYNPVAKQLIGDMRSSPALQVALQTPGGVQIRRVSNRVCPTGSLLAAGGCFSCQLGSTVSLLLHSTCLSGLASITVSDPSIQLITTSVPLTGIPTNYTIYILTPNRVNSFTLTISAATSITIPVRFEARDSVDYRPPGLGDNTTTDDGDANGGCGFVCSVGDFFNDIFTGIGSWWEYIVFVVIIIIVIILIPVAIKIVKFTFSGYSIANLFGRRKTKAN